MRTLAVAGGRMPALGLGTWKSEPGAVERAVREAARLGYRHFDCSPVYGNEPEVGRALSACFDDGTLSRDRVWVTSKLWNDAHHADDVFPALERTLSDLGLDRLDLYLIHWPIAQRRGVGIPETGSDLVPIADVPIADTWRRLEDAVDAGLTRFIGLSNFSAPKIEAVLEGARVGPAVLQVELHPYLQQSDLVRFCADRGIAVTAYSPLGSPDRPARLKPEGEPVLLDDPAIAEIARARDASPAQVLIAWALARGTSVIPKSVTPARLAENFAATEIELDASDMRRIEALDRHRRYISGEFWAMPGSPYTVEWLWNEQVERLRDE